MITSRLYSMNRYFNQCSLCFHHSSFPIPIPSKTHTTLLFSGMHIEHLPLIMTSVFGLKVRVVRRRLVRSSTTASVVPDIATGINAIQLSPKFDHPPRNTSNWTLRARKYGFVGGLINASTILVTCKMNGLISVWSSLGRFSQLPLVTD